MTIRLLLLPLRLLLLCLIALSVLAFVVRRTASEPEGVTQTLFNALASLPQTLVDVAWNVTADRFAQSRTPDEFSGSYDYRPVVNHSPYHVAGLVMRTGPGPGGSVRGWRILYGIFQIDGAPRYAALLLSPAFAIEHARLITDEMLSERGLVFRQASYPHGFAVLGDGSIVVGFDGFYRTVRIDGCGGRVWTSEATLNHAIYPVEGDRFAWGVGDERLEKIDLANGRLVQSIDVADLRAANPEIGVLDMRRIDDNDLGGNSRTDAERQHEDAYHINDVEPLSPALAHLFPAFAAGDLLVSFRSLNLVAVVDPRTRRIKWMSNNFTLRQHDPDWEPSGEISVLDNRMGREASRILVLNPATGAHRISVDGRRHDFYTRIRGKQQSLPGGGTLITSSQQGRVLELDRRGRIAAELLVRDPASPERNFVISEARYFAPDDPLLKKVRTCPKS